MWWLAGGVEAAVSFASCGHLVVEAGGGQATVSCTFGYLVVMVVELLIVVSWQCFGFSFLILEVIL